MTKAELVDLVCKSNDNLTKKAGGELLDSLFGNLQTSIVDEGKFSYPGFGTFTVRTRKARTGIDPRTREKIQIKESRTVGFKPAKAFKEKL
ncbi:MAG: HU family DNA-binding protein [Deltaproteobacteria bacterium]|nr:HU family DNA-binding protein [Deltaproteobacteria bacterium]